MKRQPDLVASAGLILAGLTCLLLMAGGCQIGAGRYDPNTGNYDPTVPADPVVVRAEQSLQTAQSLFDKFMRFEKENRDRLWAINPEIKHVADKIRTDGKPWLDDLDGAIVNYQMNRSVSNLAVLDKMLNVVEDALTRSQRYLTYESR